MRIDAYNQIAQVYKTTSAAKLQKTENARHGRSWILQILRKNYWKSTTHH